MTIELVFVLQAVAAKLDLAEELVYYFGLFLVKKEAKHENESKLSTNNKNNSWS